MAMLTQTMPFGKLTDFDIQEEFISEKRFCIEKMENNGFSQFLRDYSLENDISSDKTQSCRYYDINEFNEQHGRNTHSLRVFHMNIRRFGKHRGSFRAFLETLDWSFDILILTEIGHDADHYINSAYLDKYDSYLTLPRNNTYGGSAIFVKNGLGEIYHRNDLVEDIRHCDCSQCEYESLWIKFRTKSINYPIGAIYRHQHGSPSHFTEELKSVLNKLPRDNILSGWR